MDTDAAITVPWKNVENKTNGKSIIEQRIAQIRQEQPTNIPSPINTVNDTPKQKRTKISDICKSFLKNSSSDNENISKTDTSIDINTEEEYDNRNIKQESDDNTITEPQNNTRKRRTIDKRRKVNN